MMKCVTISVKDAEPLADLEALTEWFDLEPELRGLVKPADAVPGVGELGALSDALIAAVGSGGAVTALAASLTALFSQQRWAKLHLLITRTDGTRVELDADQVSRKSVPELTELLLHAEPDGDDAAR
jgi:hypothetical protein